MDAMRKKATLSVTMVFMILSAIFQGCFPDASQPPNKRNSIQSAAARASLLFPVTGNVYPLGYYSVSLTIGNPPKVFEFDIDTGSDLTWVQCDAPCTGCTKPKENLYKLQKHNLVQCKHPSCEAVHSPGSPHCETSTNQCDFEVEYVDHGSALGVLVADNIFLSLTNGSKISPHLIFGCAYDLKNPGPYPPPSTDGVLGLSSGKASILSQLHSMDLTRNVIGHCLSGGGGGYVFLGDDLIPSSGVVWMPMSSDAKHYLSIPAELLLGGKPTGIKDLKIVFDSGSSYTYFSSQIYEGVLNLLSKDVNGKPLNVVNDPALPICWKGRKPFKLISDVRNHSSTLALSFTHSKNAQLQLPPEDYLIVMENGNVCSEILNGTEVGLKNFNIIGGKRQQQKINRTVILLPLGILFFSFFFFFFPFLTSHLYLGHSDISLHDKMVIYENEKYQIGWISTNCDGLPKLGCNCNEDVRQPYTADFGILEEHFPETEASEKRNKFSKRKLQGIRVDTRQHM